MYTPVTRRSSIYPRHQVALQTNLKKLRHARKNSPLLVKTGLIKESIHVSGCSQMQKYDVDTDRQHELLVVT